MRFKKMTINLLVAFIFLTFTVFSVPGEVKASEELASGSTAANSEVKATLTSLQVPFVQNEGQIRDEQVKFYAQTFAGNIFVTDKGITYALNGKEGQIWALREEFAGAAPITPTGSKVCSAKVNSYMGSDPSLWKSGLSTYEEVALGEIYEQIKVNLYAYGNNLEKRFIVSPGGDPAAISLKVMGTDGFSINAQGELELATAMGTVKMTRPVAYQEIDGQRVNVDIAYLIKDDTYGFRVGDYDRSCPLVIDPLLASSFLGVNGFNEKINNIVYYKGYIYVVGSTYAAAFPKTTGAVMTGTSDIFVSTLKDDLSALQYSTLFGSDGSDTPTNIAVNDAGVYIAGTTTSSNFPVLPSPGAVQTIAGNGGDPFITKLSPDSLALSASTYFGGANNSDCINGMVLDPAGKVYVTGYTKASNFPVKDGGDDTLFGMQNSQDAFVSKLNGELTALLASTLLGGKDGGTDNSNIDEGMALALDPTDGGVYVTGWTSSTVFPTTGSAYQQTSPVYGGVFVSKFNNDLSDLQYSTLIGQEGSSSAYIANQISRDAAGNIFVAGIVSATATGHPPTEGSYSSPQTGLKDVFVSKMEGNLSDLLKSSRFGSSSNDTLVSMELDEEGNVYLLGTTTGNNYPTMPWAYQPAISGTATDYFISRLNTDLSSLNASTYLGSPIADSLGGMALGPDGSVYVAGYTKSPSFPHINGGYQPENSEGSKTDGIIVKLSPDLSRETPYWPGTPALTATNVNDAGLTLTWTPAAYYTGVDSYRIYQDNTLVKTVSGTVYSCNIAELVAEKSYTFKVEAGSATDLWSTDGPTLAQTTPASESEPPTWPGASSLTTENITETGLTLKWIAATDNTAVNGYKVYQGEALLGSVGGSTLTYNISGLSPGTQYTFLVKAGDAFDNWSTVSNPAVTITTGVNDDIAPVWPDNSSLRVEQ
ncbi:MAG: hypothetical protein CVU90_10345 [Firmicutes bacterium HGW-Firmicutes-15]|nr:MAG: hypothetical protein CVU90_10345 [Firmicutes bacterium HGW-Firmicutes-15]